MVFYSRLSPQVLYHMPKDYLVHKLVGLEERVGSESSDYQIRALQSSGILKQTAETGAVRARRACLDRWRGPTPPEESKSAPKLP